MPEELVPIIMPTFNFEQTIINNVEFVLAQIYSNFLVVCSMCDTNVIFGLVRFMLLICGAIIYGLWLDILKDLDLAACLTEVLICYKVDIGMTASKGRY